MKYAFHIFFLLIFCIIQPTWLEYIEIFGAKANLFLTYLIIISCFCSKKEGAVVGFIFGLFLDLLIGKIIGANAVLLMVLGFFVAEFCHRFIRKNNLLICIMITTVASLLYELLYYIVAFLGNLTFGTVLLRIILPEVLSNIVATVPIYLIAKKVSKFFWDGKGENVG